LCISIITINNNEMKKLFINTIILLFILITSCNLIKQRNNKANDEIEVDEVSQSEEVFKNKWQPRIINNNIIGFYITKTPPLICGFKITKDSLAYLERYSYRYNIFIYDTLKISTISKQEPTIINFNSICIKSSNHFFDTAYYNNGFLLFKNDTNYLMFYKLIDEEGNLIDLPEYDIFEELYFSYLHVSGIEKRIIEYYFDPQIAELPKLEYVLPDSIFKKLSTRKRRW